MAELVAEKPPAALEPRQVARPGREDDRAAPGVVAVDRLVGDQRLERLAPPAARARTAAAPRRARASRARASTSGLKPGQHEPAVPAARAPADRVPLEHRDVDAAPRERAGGGEPGVPAADDRHVGPIRRSVPAGAGDGRRGAVQRQRSISGTASRAPHALAEDLGVAVHVRLGHGRREQRHVVERREQDAAVERREVHVALELGVDRGRRLAAVPRRRRAEPVLGPAAEPLHDPGQPLLARSTASHAVRRSARPAGSSAR